MGLMECASGASVWRGYDYFKEKRVSMLVNMDTTAFSAIVAGSGGNQYIVTIDVAHPRKSKCTCPHANGKRIVCKHMIAVYFAAFPEEAEKFYKEFVSYQEEEEKRQEEIEDKLYAYVSKMNKDELETALLQLLFGGPDWQYERFIQEHLNIW